jgi:hypothetical protein
MPTVKKITRKVFICAYCEGIYADEPVAECDCLGGNRKPEDFIESRFSYEITTKEKNGTDRVN